MIMTNQGKTIEETEEIVEETNPPHSLENQEETIEETELIKEEAIVEELEETESEELL